MVERGTSFRIQFWSRNIFGHDEDIQTEISRILVSLFQCCTLSLMCSPFPYSSGKEVLILNGVSLILLTVAAFYLYLGVDVIRKDPHDKNHRAFFFVAFTGVWWAITFAFLFAAPDPETAWIWLRLSYPGWVFLPVPILHACLIFSRMDTRLGKWLYPLVYLPGLFFLYLALTRDITNISYSPRYGYSGGSYRGHLLEYLAFNIYYLSVAIGGSALIASWGRRTTQKGEKKQTRIMNYSMVMSVVLIFLVGTLFPALEITIIPRVTPLMATPWLIGLWFALTRYRRLHVLTPTIAAEEILSSIQDLFVMINPKGHIQKINHRSSFFLGLQPDELLNGSLWPFFPEEERQKVSAVISGDKSRLQEEMILIRKDRTTIPVKVQGAVIIDRDGDLMGTVLFFQDLTLTLRLREEAKKRREAEEELQQTHLELKEKDRQKTDFLSLISHELRTPLTSILGFVQIIKKKFEQSICPHLDTSEKAMDRALRQFRSNVGIIMEESKRLSTLINDVLDIKKMETGDVEWNMQSLQMEEVVQQAILSTSSLFEEKQLPLIQEIEGNLPPIWGDRDRLIQVMINLLSNAVKFTHTGQVTCLLGLEDHHLLIQIQDTGKGIPEEDLDEVFSKFHQVKGTTREGYKGTGLGLPICRNIVEHHSGRIWAQSTPGEGSTFSFTLPVLEERGSKKTGFFTSSESLEAIDK